MTSSRWTTAWQDSRESRPDAAHTPEDRQPEAQTCDGDSEASASMQTVVNKRYATTHQATSASINTITKARASEKSENRDIGQMQWRENGDGADRTVRTVRCGRVTLFFCLRHDVGCLLCSGFLVAVCYATLCPSLSRGIGGARKQGRTLWVPGTAGPVLKR